MGDLTESPTPQPPPTATPPSRQVPSREDCWTEEATATLVEAWGRRFLELNRGNLRQKDWQEVADAVNALHGHTKKTRRTDVQCKNRIDTLKKKYKTEKKAKIAESNETLTSSWPFFSRLDYLIGSIYKNQPKPPPTMAMPLMILPPPPPAASSSVQIQSTMPFSLPSPPMAVPLPYRKPMMPAMSSVAYTSPMVMPQKRPSPSPGPEESLFRRNYSAVAAAAAAMNDDDEASDEDDEDNGVDDEDRVNASEEDEEDEGVGDEIGLKRLAKAIEKFAEMYEKIEMEKQRQMIEMEKQRMQFAKEMEVQRMQLFMDTQVQLEKMKRAKRDDGSSDGNDES